MDDLRRLVQTFTTRSIWIESVKECLSFAGEDSPRANLLLSVMGDSENPDIGPSRHMSRKVQVRRYPD